MFFNLDMLTFFNYINSRFYTCIWVVIIYLYIFSFGRIYNLSYLSFQNEEWCLLAMSILSVGTLLLVKQIKYLSLNKIDIGLCLFLLYIAFHSWKDSVGNFDMIKLYSIILLYFLIKVSDFRIFNIVLYIIIFSAISQIIDGYLGFEEPWSNMADIRGLFYNTSVFGGFVGIAFIILFGLIFLSINNCFFYFALIIPVFIQILYSNSRASWISILVCMLYLLFFNRKISRSKCVFITFGLIALLFIGGYFYKQSSSNGRLFIWNNTLNLVTSSLMLGKGTNSFEANYMLAQAAYIKKHPQSSFAKLADNVLHPFNEYLKILLEHGLVGLFYVLLLLYNIFVSKEKVGKRKCVLISKMILLGLFVFAFFSYPFLYIQFIMIVVFCLAIISSYTEQREYINGECFNKYCTIITLFVFAFLGSKSTIDTLSAHVKWSELSNKLLSKDVLQQYNDLYLPLRDNPVFLVSYANKLFKGKEYTEAQKMLDLALNYRISYYTYLDVGMCYAAQGYDSLALSYWEKASLMIPTRFRPIYLRARLFKECGDKKNMNIELNILTKKERKVDTPAIERMIEDLK